MFNSAEDCGLHNYRQSNKNHEKAPGNRFKSVLLHIYYPLQKKKKKKATKKGLLTFLLHNVIVLNRLQCFLEN